MKKVYLAGPDVFRENAQEHGAILVRICEHYGLEGKYPLDNELNLPEDLSGPAKAMIIYQANVELIKQCDAVVANVSAFRGLSADPGTCVEIGIAIALGLPVALYSDNSTVEYKDRISSTVAEASDYPSIEDFGLIDNLMVVGPTNGVVFETIEGAVMDIARQLK